MLILFAMSWMLGLSLAMAPAPEVDEIPDDLASWIETDPPSKDSERWLVANNDDHEWAVTLRDGRPHVRPHDRKAEAATPLPFAIEPGSARGGLAGRRWSVEVDDGWIVAFNAGEFGAGLWWFSPDGKDRRKVSDSHVSGFIPTDSGLLALEGLAHMNRDRGRILRLSRGEDGRWRSEDLLDLEAAPQASARLDGGALLVATSDRLLKIDPATRKVEVLLEAAFWGGLYPNSMVVTPAGVVYLGMRHGVARVEKVADSRRVRWLLPNKAFVERKVEPGFR